MALGMIEVYGFTTSIVVADRVAKTADVQVVAIDKNVLYVYSFVSVLLYGAGAEVVVAHLRNEAYLSAETCSCHCLVSAFSAGIHKEITADDCLAGLRQSLGVYDHICVATAYYYYSFTHNFYFLFTLRYFLFYATTLNGDCSLIMGIEDSFSSFFCILRQFLPLILVANLLAFVSILTFCRTKSKQK